jgi:cell division topological specificity factor
MNLTSILNLFKRGGTAPVARDRLQILLAHERTIAGGSDLVAVLREEILAVIKKHVHVESEKVLVKMERGESVSTLEVEIEVPTPTKAAAAAARPKLATPAAAAATPAAAST